MSAVLHLLKQKVIAALERLEPAFDGKWDLNFVAVHKENPDSHIFIGASPMEDVETALRVLRERGQLS